MTLSARLVLCVWLLLLLVFSPPPAECEARMVGDLPRTGDRPLEALPGLETEFGELRTPDGARLRTIVTRPAGAAGRLPAVLYVQWLSCDTIELSPDARDGWSTMLRELMTRSGVLWQRVDKAGVGDSRGPACSALDYETELAHHRAAFRQLLARPDVDPRRVVVFGASMGANMAPLIAADQDVAGVVVWGGGATTWYERTLRFERNALELGDTDPAMLAAEVSARAAFLTKYLIEGQRTDRHRASRSGAGQGLVASRRHERRQSIRPSARVPPAGAAAELGRRVGACAQPGARTVWRIRLVREPRCHRPDH